MVEQCCGGAMSLRSSIVPWPASSITHAGPICILGQFCVWRSLDFWPALRLTVTETSTWRLGRPSAANWKLMSLRHLSATFQKQFARHKSLKCPNSFATEQFDLLATKYFLYSFNELIYLPHSYGAEIAHRLILIARVLAIPCNCFKCCFSSSLSLWSIFVASFIIGKN